VRDLLALLVIVVLIAAAFEPERTGRWVGTFGASIANAFNANTSEPKP
jgi:hypothetical protein